MHKVVCVDLDGTISRFIEWVDECTFGDLIPNADFALSELKSKGYIIIIYTTRSDKKEIAKFLKKTKSLLITLMKILISQQMQLEVNPLLMYTLMIEG